ncbi:MAG: FecR domain-containing protein [Planctomycetota bacterium]|nr:FecR domain-containing protein [Planctomycetota bacterium]
MADAPEPHDPRDRMVDMLLWETLGKQEPPNLVGPILRRADAQERSRKLRLVFGVVAAAAMVGLSISGFLWLTRAPAPNVVKDQPKPEQKTPEEKTEAKPEIARTEPAPEVKTPDALEWARGNTVETGNEPKVATLGGYARVEAAPNTRLKVEGEEKAEQIYLEKGRVTCEVDKKTGSFAVRTPAGVVRVTGTKFSVRVPQAENEHHADAKPQQFSVEVAEGAVEMRGEWGRESVHAGGRGGVVNAIVLSRGEDGVMARVEGEREPMRLMLPLNGDHKINREQFQRILNLAPGAKIQAGWLAGKDGGREFRRIIGFEPLGARENGGNYQGMVTEKGETWIRVRNEAGVNERFNVVWKGGQPQEGGGHDKRMMEKIARLNKNDRVTLRWSSDEGLRVLGIEKVGGDRPEGERKDGERKEGERKEGDRREGERREGERKGDAR